MQYVHGYAGVECELLGRVAAVTQPRAFVLILNWPSLRERKVTARNPLPNNKGVSPICEVFIFRDSPFYSRDMSRGIQTQRD